MKLVIFWTVCSLFVATGSVDGGVPSEEAKNGTSPVTAASVPIENGTTSTYRTIFAVEAGESVPDDYLNWFFHHSFKKLDEFFQSEDEKETRRDTLDDLSGTSKNWKVRVSKVILKLVLIILAIVGSILFILGVFLFMLLSFLACKFLGHVLQCFQERQKPKNSSTTYQVNV